MNGIEHPVVLEGTKIRLIPLMKEHLPDLIEAGKHPIIWEQLPADCSRKGNMAIYISEAILKRASGEQYPFTIIDKVKDKVIGSTRLFELYPEHKKLEIGWTWFTPDYWGTGYNTECKLVLLTYCFDVLRANRIQIKTRNTNLRSQAAIRKIGASFEGVLRQDRVMPNGEIRDTMVFSILHEEWHQVKALLEEMLKEKAGV